MITTTLTVALVLLSTTSQAKTEREIERESKLVGINFGTYELPNRYYVASDYFYYDEQPLKFKVQIVCNQYKSVNIGRDDWYNLLEFFVSAKPSSFVYDDYNENSNKIIDKTEPIKEGERKINYKVIKGEDLINATINPGEEKYAIIEVYDKDNKPLVAGYEYSISISSRDELPSIGATRTYTILEPRSTNLKKDWLRRKGDEAVKEKNYLLALKYYNDVLKLEFEKGRKDINKYRILHTLSTVYEKNKDYQKAKETMQEALVYFDKRYNLFKKITKYFLRIKE
jgi:hypothetical protein